MLMNRDPRPVGALCVSCDPDGAAPVSNAEFSRSAPEEFDSGSVRAMSENGQYVFFDSADPLVARASNETLDVYQWHEGQVSLIGSGTSQAPSFFLGASADGSNVFFGTHAQLVPQDTDSLGDVYDARICTSGEPCLPSPAGEATAQCEGDACQAPPLAPRETSPGSLSFSGAGNLAAPEVKTVARAKAKPLTRAQKLTAALKTCRHDRSKAKRASCEKQARKKYGPAKVKKKASKAKSNGRSE